MHTRLLRNVSLALLFVFASVMVGCGEAKVDVKETVSTPATGDTEKEGCCGGCCEDDSATETSVTEKKACCGNCAKEEQVAAKECCGKCEKDATKTQLVTTEAKACEYCKDGDKGKACEECKKQQAETVSTETKK